MLETLDEPTDAVALAAKSSGAPLVSFPPGIRQRFAALPRA